MPGPWKHSSATAGQLQTESTSARVDCWIVALTNLHAPHHGSISATHSNIRLPTNRKPMQTRMPFKSEKCENTAARADVLPCPHHLRHPRAGTEQVGPAGGWAAAVQSPGRVATSPTCVSLLPWPVKPVSGAASMLDLVFTGTAAAAPTWGHKPALHAASDSQDARPTAKYITPRPAGCS